MTDRAREIEKAEGPGTALERNRAAAGALSVVARKLRFSTSRRSKLYQTVGLRPRLTDRIFKLLFVAAFLFCLILPNAAAIAYYGFLASDQFQAETRFTVRTSAPLANSDTFGEVSGVPSAKIVQDTQIVTNFIVSRAMLAILEDEAEFERRYTRTDADWFARLEQDAPIEDRLDYWEDMVDTGIDPQSGIVVVQVRAFTADDAHRILETIVAASETLINDLNDRIWADVTASAEVQVARSTEALALAREELQTARNEAGILTIESTSSSISALLTQVQGEKIALENTFRSNAETISEDAPQMRVLARQIASKEQQIEELRASLAGGAGVGENLADASSRFSQLNLEQQLAEQQLAASITALEQLQFSSQQQLMYLDPFLAPTLPESAEYPRRVLWITVVFFASLLALALTCGALSMARTRLD